MSGDSVVGTTWQIIANLLKAEDPPAPIEVDAAGGGLDRLVGHLDDRRGGSESELHVPLDESHHLARRRTQRVAEWFGEAPLNAKACDLTSDPNHCDDVPRGRRGLLRAGRCDWTTPVADCGDDRGEVWNDYSEWVTAWTEIKG